MGILVKKDNKNSKIPGKDNNKNSTAGVIPEKKADKKHECVIENVVKEE